MVMRKMTALLTFVLIICLLPAAAFAKTFKEGDKDWKIMVTQQKLKTLGYATDRTDGKFSKATADSLKNFQKKTRSPSFSWFLRKKTPSKTCTSAVRGSCALCLPKTYCT